MLIIGVPFGKTSERRNVILDEKDSCLFLGKKKGCNVAQPYYVIFSFEVERMYFLGYLYHHIQKFVR